MLILIVVYLILLVATFYHFSYFLAYFAIFCRVSHICKRIVLKVLNVTTLPMFLLFYKRFITFTLLMQAEKQFLLINRTADKTYKKYILPVQIGV